MQNKQEKAQYFIGRQRELAIFDEWLLKFGSEEPWILYFHDALQQVGKKGGVGKTLLLKQCEMRAREVYPDLVIVRIDFFNVADRGGTIIGDRVVLALEAAYPTWRARQYAEHVPPYLDAIRSGQEKIEEVRGQLADALLADLSELGERLQEDRKYLLMLFDTYELIEQNPGIAVLRHSQSFPDDYHFERIGVVVAGRNQLDWTQPNWRDRESEVLEVALAPFDEDEMILYFDLISTVNLDLMHQYAHALYERTEGRPILVGLVTDVLNRRVISVEDLVSISQTDFDARLVAKINDFERPFDKIILYMAHVYHRFNFELLYWLFDHAHMQEMLSDMDDTALQQQLLDLSFVRRPGTVGEDFVLHDEMRPLIIRYCWEQLDPDRRSRKEISGYMIEYYEDKLAIKGLSEQLRQAYIVEMLYHKLFLNITRGYTFFEQSFHQANLLWLNAFARSLLDEASKFLSDLSVEQRYMLKRYEAQLLQRKEKSDEALVLYEQLEHEANPIWLEKQSVEIVYEKGVCYYQLSKFPEAIEAFNYVRKLAKVSNNKYDYASMLNWLGATYLRQGQWDTALTYFDESIGIHKQLGNRVSYTSILNSVGDTYRLQGKIDEALRRTKIAHRIRYDLFTEGRISEVFVGWSLSAIGTIYMDIDDLVAAEKSFSDAYEIFTRLGSKKGLATMYNRFGQLDSFRGKQDEALEWHQKAYANALGNIDMTSQINSLNKQGELHIQRKNLSEAESVLTRSVIIAQQFYDYYQQSEALISLVKVYKRQNRNEQAELSLQALEEICRKYNYNYLLGLSRAALGDFYAEREAYQEAFRYYGEACHFMASYNTIKYNKFLRKMIDELLLVSGVEIVSITQSLITYWHEQRLAEKFPDFITLCEEVRSLMAA